MKGKHFEKRRKSGKRIKNKEKKENRKKLGVFSKIVLTISILVFLVCLAILGFWLYSNKELGEIEEQLSYLVTEVPEGEEQEGSIKVDFEELKKINQDVIGWIYIKNTDINYPILQTTDNEYYLKKSINKTYSSCGSIFLDCKTKKDFSEKNTVIYGHNLKNQKMFADLAKVYKGELGNNIEIEIYTENSFRKYKIFTCYMEEPNLNVIQKNWNEEEKQEFIDNAIKKSKIDFSCDIDYSKNLLTLITCDATGKERIIVHAM